MIGLKPLSSNLSVISHRVERMYASRAAAKNYADLRTDETLKETQKVAECSIGKKRPDYSTCRLRLMSVSETVSPNWAAKVAWEGGRVSIAYRVQNVSILYAITVSLNPSWQLVTRVWRSNRFR
jgi:hypothetical protein